MGQKSSLPQLAPSVSQALMPDSHAEAWLPADVMLADVLR